MTNTDTLRIADTSSAASETSTQPSIPGTSRAQQSRNQAVSAPCAADGRKLALLKRAGLFGSDLKGAQITRATSLEDLQKAYALVHEVYLASGYIHSEPSGMRLRIFETSSDTATFIAKADGRVVGVISVVGDSVDLGLPSDSAFRAELDAVRATGIRLCEVTNQVVADDYRKSAVTTELMRCAVAHSIKVGYRGGVATVSPSHNGFYDLLGFQEIGSERSYSTKLHDPVVALMIDFDMYRTAPAGLSEAAAFVRNFLGIENPYLNRVMMWDRKARAHFLNAELLEELFVIRSNFLAQCTPAELEIVRLRWGQELFRTVAGSLPTYAEEPAQSAVPFPDFQPTVATSRLQSECPFPFVLNERTTTGRRQANYLSLLGNDSHAEDNPKPATLWHWIRAVLETRDSSELALGN